MKDISTWRIVWTFISGGGTGLIDYALDVGNNALSGLAGATKEKVTAVLNVMTKILSIAEAVRIFIPTKWQIAYTLTIEAIRQVIAALSDFNVSGAELDEAIANYRKAVDAWKGPDDATCIGPGEVIEAEYKELD